MTTATAVVDPNLAFIKYSHCTTHWTDGEICNPGYEGCFKGV